MLEDYKTNFVLNTTMELSAGWSPLKPHMRRSDVFMQSFTKNRAVKVRATPCEMAEAGFYYMSDSRKVTVAPHNYGQP